MLYLHLLNITPIFRWSALGGCNRMDANGDPLGINFQSLPIQRPLNLREKRRKKHRTVNVIMSTKQV
jgi:hypothetical protein